jgi:hypothetical protein
MTILLWGIPGERPLDAVRSALGDLRQRAVLFDQRAVLETSIELDVDRDARGRLVGPGYVLDLATVRAVYVRPYDPTEVPAVVAAGVGSAAWDHARAVHDAVRVWCEITPAFMVNRLSAAASNNSKPYQAALLLGLGFRVPTTLVTTDPAAARAFIAEHTHVIYKSVSAVRSVVARYTAAHDARLEHIARCPTQFQAYVGGADVRVHVVGDEVFATRITTRAVDYRYPGADDVVLARVDLPADIAARCRTTARGLGLAIAGIDLRLAPDGDWYAFEVNPSPAFSYYDQDGAIARAVAALLATGGQP